MLKSLLVCVLLCFATDMARADRSCDNLPHADHPKAVLSNDGVEAVIFLPDATNGYYRSTRFDWSGVVGCLSYKGHTFWGEWFPKYDPLLNDSITGPVEEFRSEDGALGYAAARPGGLFVKPGVGVLRKVDDSPYKFGTFYPLVDTGQWTIHTGKHSIRFQQRLHSPTGISYIYTKTLKLEKGGVLILKHQLKNIGSKNIKTDVYDHDFFMLDGKPTGPGMSVHFPFGPKVSPSPDNAFHLELAKIEGNSILYLKELQPRQSVAAYLIGYSQRPSDYDITVEDHASGISVEQTSDSPIAKLYLWSIRSTISPEAYVHLDVKSGRSQKWTIRYRFFVH
jgi:hypothetical protein